MKDTNPNFVERNSTAIIVIGLIVVCLGIYGQTFRFDFINVDDRQYIYENPVVVTGLNPSSIWWAITAVYSGNWHPVTWLTHLLDVQLYGMNAGGHHATNVIIHTLASVLAYFAFNRLTGTVWQSALVAALFAVHPAHVESVAWIAERRDVLTALFMMLTLLAYARFARAETSAKWKWMTITSLCLALGLMSKGMLVTMPFVLLLCDYWPLKRLNSLSDLPKLLLEKTPVFVLIAFSAVMTFYAQSTGGYVADLQILTPLERLKNVGYAYGEYVRLLFYPLDLSVFYPIDTDRSWAGFAVSVGLLLLVTALCVWFGRTRRYLFVGWFWFVGMMFPVVGVVQIGGQSMADRYTYVPYFGLFIILIWGFVELIQKLKLPTTLVATIAIVVVAAFGIRAFDQAAKWKNSGTLYEHSVAVTKKNYPLKANLCLYYFKTSDSITAENKCTQLLEGMPATGDGYNILGTLAAQNGKYADARTFFEKAIAERPDWDILHLNLAMATAKTGDPAKALVIIQKATASRDGSVLPPALSRAYFVIAGEFERKGERAKSLETLTKAVEIDPTFAEAANLLERMRAASK